MVEYCFNTIYNIGEEKFQKFTNTKTIETPHRVNNPIYNNHIIILFHKEHL